MKINWKYMIGLIGVLGIGVFLIGTSLDTVAARPNGGTGETFHASEPVVPGESLPVTDLPTEIPPILYREINPLRNPSQFQDGMGQKGSNTNIQDPLVGLNELPTGDTPGLLFDFEGMGDFNQYAPPDTVGDVGPNHYVQMVNVSFAIYDKSGNLLTGPTPYNALFSGFGGVCQNNNDGDPIVVYDPLADRWVLSQFADIFGSQTQCIAVSKTPDPTGEYWLYAFPLPEVPDYPKFGVWPDAYYMGTNSGFPNAYYAHAFDRVKMLAGQPATSQSVGGKPNFLMPADIDGPTGPAAGTPGLFYTYLKEGYSNHPPGVDRIELYEFDVDWATPANTTFTMVQEFPISAFNYTVCGFFVQSCIPQLGTSNRIDSLSYWPMFRFAYRNLGSYEAMVGNFTVDTNGSDHAGIRWFELRDEGSGWVLQQEGTLAPDNQHRFMGSIAMDGSGNIALGYSVSGSATKPAIRYATRQLGDPPGTMQTEASLIEGAGAQTSIQRWGDYAALSVDPADECTFWLTSEYHDVDNNGFSWNTRVGVFKEPSCTGALGPDFTIQVTPGSQEVCTPNDAVFTVDIGSVEGFVDPVTLSASGNPAGTTPGFSTNPVIPPGSSTLTIGNTGAATAGSYDIDVVGVAPTSTHTSTVTLDVFTAVPGAPVPTAPTNGATGVSLAPAYNWSASTQGTTYDLEVATDNAFTNIVYSASGISGTSHQQTTPLDPITTYYWRLKSANICGTGAYSATYSFMTRDIPPILLVDDDDNSPNVQSYWTDTLNTLGYDFDVFDTGNSDNEPSASELLQYETVLWFSGDEFGGAAGPGSAGEAALATYLDNGGCLFISSQDYHYDKDLTSFMTGYLGVSSLTDDNGDYTGVEGVNVFGGLGPYPLSYPFTDYSDPITPGNGGVVAMLGTNGKVGGVSKDGGAYKTSFWAFGWEGISTSGRQATLQTFIDWCGLPSVAPDIDVTPASLSSTQPADTAMNKTLTIANTGTSDLVWTIAEDNNTLPLADWSDDFDSYATGTQLHGVGGWKGWFNDPAAGALTSAAQAQSSPNSVDILGATDLVHEYPGTDSGQWTYTAYQYIPSSFSGQTYFIMLNQYNDAGSGLNWSVQVMFDSASGNVVNDGSSGGSMPYKTNQWVEIRLEIDLDADTQDFYYDNTLLYSGTWSGEVSGGGITSIAAVDLFANGASSVYYDDLSMVQANPPVCAAPTDIPWLSLAPAGGTTGAGSSDDVTVTFDSTGLAEGAYDANLCVTSNDLDENLVIVPVTLNVTGGYDIYLPLVTKDQ